MVSDKCNYICCIRLIPLLLLLSYKKVYMFLYDTELFVEHAKTHVGRTAQRLDVDDNSL